MSRSLEFELDLERQSWLLVTLFAGQLVFTAAAGRLVDRFGSVHVLGLLLEDYIDRGGWNAPRIATTRPFRQLRERGATHPVARLIDPR